MEYPKALGPMLGRCAHLTRERMDARLAGCDVTPAQTHTLLYLHRHGGQAPQCAVTEFLKVKPSTANGILDRMEEKGLVTRSVSGSDARRHPDREGKGTAGAVPADLCGHGECGGPGLYT